MLPQTPFLSFSASTQWPIYPHLMFSGGKKAPVRDWRWNVSLMESLYNPCDVTVEKGGIWWLNCTELRWRLWSNPVIEEQKKKKKWTQSDCRSAQLRSVLLSVLFMPVQCQMQMHSNGRVLYSWVYACLLDKANSPFYCTEKKRLMNNMQHVSLGQSKNTYYKTTDGYTERWKGGWMERWKDRWMDGWKDEHTDGWMDGQTLLDI